MYSNHVCVFVCTTKIGHIMSKPWNKLARDSQDRQKQNWILLGQLHNLQTFLFRKSRNFSSAAGSRRWLCGVSWTLALNQRSCWSRAGRHRWKVLWPDTGAMEMIVHGKCAGNVPWWGVFFHYHRLSTQNVITWPCLVGWWYLRLFIFRADVHGKEMVSPSPIGPIGPIGQIRASKRDHGLVVGTRDHQMSHQMRVPDTPYMVLNKCKSM